MRAWAWKFAPVAVLFAAAACDPDGLGRSNPDFHVIGHRGSPNDAPENTIPSFEVAVAVGANAVEIDVCVTSDDVLVIWHDADPDSAVALARQTGAEGLAFVPLVPAVGSTWRRPVRGLTLAQLRDHYGYAEADGSRQSTAVIPTLDDVIEWARTEDRLRAIYLDLKVGPGEMDLLASVLGEVSADPGLEHVAFYFSSVQRAVVDPLEEVRVELGTEATRVVLDVEGAGALPKTRDAGLRDVMMGLVPSITWSDFKDEIAAAVNARENGEVDSVTVWTFDREIQLAELLYYSVDGVMTNEPAQLYLMWQDSLN